MHEAKTRLSQLVAAAQAGEEVLITRHGKPVAQLVPVKKKPGMASIHGIWKGQVRMADDFDELPDDIAEALGVR